MRKWECTVCGYIHEGEEPPEECPMCGASKDKFIEVSEHEDNKSSATTTNKTEDKQQLNLVEKLILDFHLHPIMVHFPNGILPAALIFLFIALFWVTPFFEIAAFYNLVFVLLTIPFVLYTGYATWKSKYNSALTDLFKWKIATAALASLLLIIMVIWRFIDPNIVGEFSSATIIYIFLGCIMVSCIGIAGHLGGKLVYKK